MMLGDYVLKKTSLDYFAGDTPKIDLNIADFSGAKNKGVWCRRYGTRCKC